MQQPPPGVSIDELPPRRRAALERALRRVEEREQRGLERERARHAARMAAIDRADLLPFMGAQDREAELARHEATTAAIRACRGGDRAKLWARALAALAQVASAADRRDARRAAARRKREEKRAAAQLPPELRFPARAKTAAELEAHRERLVQFLKEESRVSPRFVAARNQLDKIDRKISGWMQTTGRSPQRIQASAVAALKVAFAQRDAEGEGRERHELARKGWVLGDEGVWYLFLPPGACVRAPDQAATPDTIGASDPRWVAQFRAEASRRWSALSQVISETRGPNGVAVADFVRPDPRATLPQWQAEGAHWSVKAGRRPRPTYWPRYRSELDQKPVLVALGGWDCAFVGAVTLAGTCGLRGLWSGVHVGPDRRARPVELEWRGSVEPGTTAREQLRRMTESRISTPNALAAFCPSGRLWAVVMPMRLEGSSPFDRSGELKIAAEVLSPPTNKAAKVAKVKPAKVKPAKVKPAPAPLPSPSPLPTLAERDGDSARRAELARMMEASRNARTEREREQAFAAALALAPIALARWGWADHIARLPRVPTAEEVVGVLDGLVERNGIGGRWTVGDGPGQVPERFADLAERENWLRRTGGPGSSLELAQAVARTIQDPKKREDLSRHVAARLRPARERWTNDVRTLATNLLVKAHRAAQAPARSAAARERESKKRATRGAKGGTPAATPAPPPGLVPSAESVIGWIGLVRDARAPVPAVEREDAWAASLGLVTPAASPAGWSLTAQGERALTARGGPGRAWEEIFRALEAERQARAFVPTLEADGWAGVVGDAVAVWVELHRIAGLRLAPRADGTSVAVWATPAWSDEEIRERLVPRGLVHPRRGGGWDLSAKARGFIESPPRVGLRDLDAITRAPEPAAPAPAPARAGRTRETFRAATVRLLGELERLGWSVVRTAPSGRPMKVPHASSPDRSVRLWFLPQAVHVGRAGEGASLGHARTLDVDRRGMSAEQLTARAWR